MPTVFHSPKTILSLLGLFCLISQAVLGADSLPAPLLRTNAPLPFSVEITELPFPDMPDYFGGGNGNPLKWMDFPISPVMIDDEFWVFCKNGSHPEVHRWKGSNIEKTERLPDGTVDFPPEIKRPYILGGVWYDKEEKKLYAPMHCEYRKEEREMQRQIHLASSVDKGESWQYEGAIATRPFDPTQLAGTFSGEYWDGGLGDFMLYVDERGGYIYLYIGAYTWPKRGIKKPGFHRHQVARCAISDKMRPGTWRKFYNGKWEEPGVGGKASFVNVYGVTYNSKLKKYIGMNFGNGMAFCSDLTKQDWSECVRIPGKHWGWVVVEDYAWNLVNENLTDLYQNGETAILYTYWKANGRQTQTHKYRVKFGPGETNPDVSGVFAEGYADHPNCLTDSSTFQLYAPLLESCDPIDARKTRRIEANHPEIVYDGSWAAGSELTYSTMSSSRQFDSFEWKFTGNEVYWRAVKGPDGGLADVYLDGHHEATVDCYAEFPTSGPFAFIKTGIAPKESHSLRVVVRGESGPLSSGTMVRGLILEHAAKGTRASEGFSSIMGKNGWTYRTLENGAYSDMIFLDSTWGGNLSDDKTPRSAISYLTMTADSDAIPVRTWTVSEDGDYRMEGNIRHESGSPMEVEIIQNGKSLLKKTVSEKETFYYDETLKFHQGDQIEFRAARLSGRVAEPDVHNTVSWDPMIYAIP